MIQQSRLIGLFDILGFSTRLKAAGLAQVRRRLRALIRAIRTQALTNSSPNIQPEDDDNLESARFIFDSVLLVSNPTNELRHVHNFIFASISLLEFGFNHHFPFRGSITLSDIFSDEETGVIIGDQFPELRDAEKMQEWSGCFIHPKACDLVFDSIMGNIDPEEKKRSPLGSDAFHWLKVPIKDSFARWRPLNAWCLNWASLLEEKALPVGLRYMKKQAAKLANTKQYLAHIRSLPNDLIPVKGSVPKGTMVKAIKSRYGFRTVLVDKTGNAVPIRSGKLKFAVASGDWQPIEECEIFLGKDPSDNLG